MKGLCVEFNLRRLTILEFNREKHFVFSLRPFRRRWNFSGTLNETVLGAWNVKPKRFNEVDLLPNFSHISTVYSKRVDKNLQHADFSEGHARSLGTKLQRSVADPQRWTIWTDQSRKKSEIIGKNPTLLRLPTILAPWYPRNHLKH